MAVGVMQYLGYGFDSSSFTSTSRAEKHENASGATGRVEVGVDHIQVGSDFGNALLTDDTLA
jgi:hypothetical protein